MLTEARPLLSRVADAVYWMARYIERAENVARAIEVNFYLQLDLPGPGSNQWAPLVQTSGDGEIFQQRMGQATQSNAIEFLALDTTNLNSIASCLRAARENARSIRDTITSEMWEQINSMYWGVQQRSPGEGSQPEFFRGIRMACHMFQGITDSTMSHNEAWHFACFGRQMERADKTSRILDVKYFMLLPTPSSVGTPYDDLQWGAVLKSVSGFEMYRQRHGRITPRDIVDFLVLDRDFPRSIHHSVSGADDALHAITGTPRGWFKCEAEQALGRLRAELDFASVEKIISDGLHEYLDDLQVKLNNVGELLPRAFFTSQTTQVNSPAGVR